MADKPLADLAAPAPFKSAAEDHPLIQENAKQAPPVPGQSVSPGLRAVPDSFGAPTANGDPVQHVFGPGQSAVDPVAAGLDPNFNPLTRAENRSITRTDTGDTEPARPDHEAMCVPGPTGSLEGRPTDVPKVVPVTAPEFRREAQFAQAPGPSTAMPAPAEPAASKPAAKSTAVA